MQKQRKLPISRFHPLLRLPTLLTDRHGNIISQPVFYIHSLNSAPHLESSNSRQVAFWPNSICSLLVFVVTTVASIWVTIELTEFRDEVQSNFHFEYLQPLYSFNLSTCFDMLNVNDSLQLGRHSKWPNEIFLIRNNVKKLASHDFCNEPKYTSSWYFNFGMTCQTMRIRCITRINFQNHLHIETRLQFISVFWANYTFSVFFFFHRSDRHPEYLHEYSAFALLPRDFGTLLKARIGLSRTRRLATSFRSTCAAYNRSTPEHCRQNCYFKHTWCRLPHFLNVELTRPFPTDSGSQCVIPADVIDRCRNTCDEFSCESEYFSMYRSRHIRLVSTRFIFTYQFESNVLVLEDQARLSIEMWLIHLGTCCNCIFGISFFAFLHFFVRQACKRVRCQRLRRFVRKHRRQSFPVPVQKPEYRCKQAQPIHHKVWCMQAHSVQSISFFQPTSHVSTLSHSHIPRYSPCLLIASESALPNETNQSIDVRRKIACAFNFRNVMLCIILAICLSLYILQNMQIMIGYWKFKSNVEMSLNFNQPIEQFSLSICFPLFGEQSLIKNARKANCPWKSFTPYQPQTLDKILKCMPSFDELILSAQLSKQPFEAQLLPHPTWFLLYMNYCLRFDLRVQSTVRSIQSPYLKSLVYRKLFVRLAYPRSHFYLTNYGRNPTQLTKPMNRVFRIETSIKRRLPIDRGGTCLPNFRIPPQLDTLPTCLTMPSIMLPSPSFANLDAKSLLSRNNFSSIDAGLLATTLATSWPCSHSDECVEQCALRLSLRCDESLYMSKIKGPNSSLHLLWPEFISYGPNLHSPLRPFRSSIHFKTDFKKPNLWTIEFCTKLFPKNVDCVREVYTPAKSQWESRLRNSINRTLIKLKLTADTEISEQRLLYTWRVLVIQLIGLASVWFGINFVIVHQTLCRSVDQISRRSSAQSRRRQHLNQRLDRPPRPSRQQRCFYLLAMFGLTVQLLDFFHQYQSNNRILITYFRRSTSIKFPCVSICTPIVGQDGSKLIQDYRDLDSLDPLNNHTALSLFQWTDSYLTTQFELNPTPPLTFRLNDQTDIQFHVFQLIQSLELHQRHEIKKIRFVSANRWWIDSLATSRQSTPPNATPASYLSSFTESSTSNITRFVYNLFLYRDNVCLQLTFGSKNDGHQYKVHQDFFRITYFDHRPIRFYVHAPHMIHMSSSFTPAPDLSPTIRFETLFLWRSSQRNFDRRNKLCSMRNNWRRVLHFLQNGFTCNEQQPVRKSDDRTNKKKPIWFGNFCRDPNKKWILNRYPSCKMNYTNTHLPLTLKDWLHPIDNSQYFDCISLLDELLQANVITLSENMCERRYRYSMMYHNVVSPVAESIQKTTNFSFFTISNSKIPPNATRRLSTLSHLDLHPNLMDLIQMQDKRLSDLEVVIYICSTISFWLNWSFVQMLSSFKDAAIKLSQNLNNNRIVRISPTSTDIGT